MLSHIALQVLLAGSAWTSAMGVRNSWLTLKVGCPKPHIIESLHSILLIACSSCSQPDSVTTICACAWVKHLNCSSFLSLLLCPGLFLYAMPPEKLQDGLLWQGMG